MTPDMKRALLALLVALGLFFAVMIAIKMAGCGNNHEYFYCSWKISILFIFFMAIVYFAVQKWLQEAVLKKAIIALSVLFFISGCIAFASPMEAQSVFSSETGQMQMGYCPVCERLHRNPFWPLEMSHYLFWSKKQDFCPQDGTKLIKDRDMFVAKAGDHTTDAPMLRMWHGGSRGIDVFANEMLTEIPEFTLKKGERLHITASGKWKDAMGRKSGPEGWGVNPFNDAPLLCSGSYMALCVRNGNLPWQECGKECTIQAVEDARIHFAPNHSWHDNYNKFHPEWITNSSEKLVIEYIIL